MGIDRDTTFTWYGHSVYEVRTPGGKVAHREWLPFLGLVDASYWNTELLDED